MMRQRYDTRACPNAAPVGKLGEARFAREFADLDELPAVFITPVFLDDGAEIVFRSTDLSMIHAGITHGELVYVKPEQAVEALRGHVVVARVNGDYFIKRLRATDDALILASEDEEYGSIEILPDDEFHPLGIVVGRLADSRAFDRTWEDQQQRIRRATRT